MRVIYGKIGRSIIIDAAKFGPVGGDNEPIALLLQLAERHPDVEFVDGSRWSGSSGAAEQLPANITLPEQPKVEPRNTYVNGTRHFNAGRQPWAAYTDVLRPYFEDVDAVVMWAGQMGTSNVPIPKLEDRALVTNPQDCFMTYVGPITLNINAWRDVDPHARREVWLCADPRNYLKARDLKWPPSPVIAQYAMSTLGKHERWGDQRDPVELGFDAYWNEERVWVAQHEYTYDALEVVGIPDGWNESLWLDFEERRPFGILINELRTYVSRNRRTIAETWVRPLLTSNDDIHGKWSPASQEALGLLIEPILHGNIPNFLGGYRCTLTTPASGSFWATTKWHEAARLGVVCFCHPDWDAHGHVIPTRHAIDAGVLDHDPVLKHLVTWLRPETAEELASRVRAVSQSRATYEWLRDAQYALALRFKTERRALHEIERRTGLPCTG